MVAKIGRNIFLIRDHNIGACELAIVFLGPGIFLVVNVSSFSQGFKDGDDAEIIGAFRLYFR